MWVACFASGVLMANHWIPEGSNYSGVMALYGVIQINGVEQYSDQLELGVFCDDECRGSAMAEEFFVTNRYLVIPTIYGENGHLLTFKLYDHSINQELDYLASPEAVTFIEDGYGTPIEPYVLDFTGEAPVIAFHFIVPGSWSTVSNWQDGVLPSSGDEAFIDAACQLDMNAEVSALTISDGQTLTLQSGKTLTVSGTLTNTVATGLVIEERAQLINASDSVSATMLKNIVAYGGENPYGWYTIASPMDEMPIAESGFLTPEYNLFRYNETATAQEKWEDYRANFTDFTTFERGRGYLYANSNTFSPAFTGMLNNANVTCSLTCTDQPNALRGFNLIGNPFPHVIYKGSGGAIDNAHLASGYYTLTNEGAWQVHTYEDAIMPGQGILVKTTMAMELVVNKTIAAASSESRRAREAAERLKVSVSGACGADHAFAYFGQGIGLDKMENFAEEAPSLYFHDNGKDLAIAHINDEYETLDLMFKNKQDDTFTLTVSSNARYSYLHLIDYVTGTDIDLLEQSSYTFHATGQENEARFQLMFKMPVGVDEKEMPVDVFFVDGHLVGVEGEAILQVMDMTGRMVSSRWVSGNEEINLNVVSGVYLLRLVNGNNVKTQKFVAR